MMIALPPRSLNYLIVMELILLLLTNMNKNTMIESAGNSESSSLIYLNILCLQAALVRASVILKSQKQSKKKARGKKTE